MTLKYRIVRTGKFKKDLILIRKRGYDFSSLLGVVVDMLAAGDTLPEKYRDHNLSGNYSGCRECHITPDWLLVYEIADDELFLYLTSYQPDLPLQEVEEHHSRPRSTLSNR